MKTIFRSVLQRVEYALDSGLLISEEFEQAMLLDDLVMFRRDSQGANVISRIRSTTETVDGISIERITNNDQQLLPEGRVN